jgi:Leucine-rich repeat (LRR) protein
MIKTLQLVITAFALLTVTTSCSKEEPVVSVSGLTINKTTLILTEGDSETLETTVIPGNATDKTVTWTSSNPEVASVDNGVVTALTEGTATIVAFTTTSGKMATCEVTVKPQFQSIEFTFTGNEIAFYVTAKSFVVDWGDGSTEEYSNMKDDYILHIYENDAEYTVQIQNAKKLSIFYCLHQHLTALDVSNCTTLTELICSRNQLSALDVSKNTALIRLNCSDNQLSILDVSNCTTLTGLYCFDNQLSALDVSGCTALEELECYGNQLRVLDVSDCAALKALWCGNNQLSALDVSGCTVLEKLVCYGNQLSVLDVSGCAALKELSCEYNQLITLNVSGCAELRWLKCCNNQLSATALNDVFTGLPNRSGKPDGSIYIEDNPGATACDRSIAINKNWKIRED